MRASWPGMAVPTIYGHMCTLWPGSGDPRAQLGPCCPDASLALPPPRVATCSQLPSWHCPPCPAAHPCRSRRSQTSCEYEHPLGRPCWTPRSCPLPWGWVVAGLAGGWQDTGMEPSSAISISTSLHLQLPARRESGSGACLDLQVIDTVRSRRDKEDAAMHHVLRGSLYKPRRRVSTPWPWCAADPEGSSTRKSSRDGGCSVGPAAHPVSLCLSLGQYKASYSRHFISPDKQERQDKEIFRQNMKRRLETFKSTKHNVCSSKNKARLKEKGRKKASTSQPPDRFLALRFGLPQDAESEVLWGVGEVLQGIGSSRASRESSSSQSCVCCV